MKRRILSIALGITMLVGLLPTTALAEDEHSHPICGAEHTNIGDHDGTCGDIKWQPLSDLLGEPEDEKYPGATITQAGNYYLDTDITFKGSDALTIQADVSLCLNGHTLTYCGRYEGVIVESGATLNICDCSEDESGKIDTYEMEANTVVLRYGTVNLYSGTLRSEGSIALRGYVDGGNYTVNQYGGTAWGDGTYDAVSIEGEEGASAAYNLYGGTVKTISAKASGAISIMENAELFISGAPEISNASSWEYASDICTETPIHIMDELTANAPKYSVLYYNTQTSIFTDGWNDHMANAAYGDYFVSANPDLAVLKDTETGELMLGVKPPEAKWGTSAENLTGSGTLMDAFSAEEVVNYIQLQSDVTYTEQTMPDFFGIGYNEGLIFDFNGFTITQFDDLFINSSTVTIKDSREGGGIVTDEESGGIEIDGDANVTIEGGNFSGGYCGVTILDGTLDITGGEISVSHMGVDVCGGEVNITGGEIHGGMYGVWAIDGNTTVSTGAKISGGKIGILIDNIGEVTLSGGDIHGELVDICIETDNDVLTIDETLSNTYSFAFFEETVELPENAEDEPVTFAVAGEGVTLDVDSFTFAGLTSFDDNYNLILTPCSNLAVVVSEDGKKLQLEYREAPHAHPICGDGECDDHGDDKTFTAWDGSNKTLTEGSYYLSEDVTVTSTVSISDTVNLCLNGHSIENSTGSTIQVNSGATLNICDCKGSGIVKSSSNDSAGINKSGINNSGTVAVYGGTVQATGSEGRGIHNFGTVAVYGGTIEATGNSGRGIFNSGTATVSGGTVKATGEKGRGIYINSGSVTVSGGTVKATGKGIYINNGGRVTVTSGTIEATDTDGRGIDNSSGASATVTGGSITATGSEGYGIYNGYAGSFELSDTPTITGTAADVYIYGEKIITITDVLTYAVEKAISVKMGTPGTFTSGWNTNMTSADFADYFTSADSGYIVQKNNSGELELAEVIAPTYTVSVSADPAAGGTVSGGGEYDENTSVTVTATANRGYKFVKWTENDVTVSTDASYTFTATENRGLVAVFEQAQADEFEVSGTITGAQGSTYTDVTAKLIELGSTVHHAVVDKTSENNPETYHYATNAPAGYYNLVVTAETTVNGSPITVTVTSLIDLSSDTEKNAELPDGQKNSVVDTDAAGEYHAIVGGLDEIAKDAGDDDDIVEIKLTVTDKEENTVPPADAEAIKEKAQGSKLEFLDFTLTKTVNGQEEANFGSTNTHLLTIIIAFDSTNVNKDSIKIYRYHGGQAEAMTKNPADGLEGFAVGDTSITIYTKSFSTYAIGYTLESASSGDDPVIDAPSNSSNRKPKYDVKYEAEDTENGSVEISRSRVAKGKTVTITVTPEEGYQLDELLILDKNGDKVEYKDNGDGTFTFVMPRGDVEIRASFAEVEKEQLILIFTIDEKKYQKDDAELMNDVAPVIRSDRTMLPIRVVAENLGATVTWNEPEQSVTITMDDKEIVIYVGQPFALVDGCPVELDSPAFIANDRAYLPMRFVAENLGATVTWDDANQTVTIVG